MITRLLFLSFLLSSTYLHSDDIYFHDGRIIKNVLVEDSSSAFIEINVIDLGKMTFLSNEIKEIQYNAVNFSLDSEFIGFTNLGNKENKNITKSLHPVAFKVSYNFKGNHEFSGNIFGGDVKVPNSFSISIEFNSRIEDNFDLGFGIKYLTPKKLNDQIKGEFSSFSLYAISKIHFLNGGKYIPGVIGNLGYGFYISDKTENNDAFELSGGINIAFGFEIEVNKKIVYELLYHSNDGKINVDSFFNDSQKYDLTYSYFSFTVGYRF